jgi:hypothetical protein
MAKAKGAAVKGGDARVAQCEVGFELILMGIPLESEKTWQGKRAKTKERARIPKAKAKGASQSLRQAMVTAGLVGYGVVLAEA